MQPTRYSDQEIYDTLIKFKGVFIEHFQNMQAPGLCALINRLYCIFTLTEHDILEYVLKMNKRYYYRVIGPNALYPLGVKTCAAYYFKPYAFNPRLEYINELIEKYKPV